MIEDLLSKNILKIDFIKTDNTLRTMLCTRNFDKIPKEFYPKFGETTRTFNSSTIKVFDVEKQAWRSIKLTSIQNYSII